MLQQNSTNPKIQSYHRRILFFFDPTSISTIYFEKKVTISRLSLRCIGYRKRGI